jgi:hypothetical protein
MSARNNGGDEGDADKESSESLDELSDFDDLNELQERLNRDNRSLSPPLSENQAAQKLDDMFGRRESIMLQLNEEEAIQKLNGLFGKPDGMEKSYYSNESNTDPERLDQADAANRSQHDSELADKLDKMLKKNDSLTESQAEDKLDELFAKNGGPGVPLDESQAEDKLDELFGKKGGPGVPLDDSQAEDKLDELFGKNVPVSEPDTPMSASYNNLGGIVVEMLEAEKAEPSKSKSTAPVLKASVPSAVLGSTLPVPKDDKPFVMNLNSDGAKKYVQLIFQK